MLKWQADKEKLKARNRAPTAEETVERRHGGSIGPVGPAGGKGRALTTQERGEATTLGDMFLDDEESQDGSAQNESNGKNVSGSDGRKRNHADQAGPEEDEGKNVEADNAAVATEGPAGGAEMRAPEKNGIGEEVAKCVNLPAGHHDRPAKKARKNVDQSGAQQAVSHIDAESAETYTQAGSESGWKYGDAGPEKLVE